MPGPEVLVAGTLCVDLFPSFVDEPALSPGTLTEIGALRMQPGGCVANTGGALADLGTSVGLVADIGEDALGAIVVNGLERPGVDLTRIRRVPDGATAYSVVVQGSGDRCIWHHAGANATFDAADVHGDASVLHLGYPNLLARLAHDGGANVEGLFARAKSAGMTTSLDLAVVDPRSPAADVDWRAWLRRVLPVTDVVAPSVDDLRSAAVADGTGGLLETAQGLLAMGAAAVLLKGSLSGMVLATADAGRLAEAGRAFAGRAAAWADLALWTPALQVEVVSTLGAGDAAVAGLLHGVIRDLDPAMSLRCAAAAAAARVEAPGPIPRWDLLHERLRAGWRPQDAACPAGCTAAAPAGVA